MIKIQNILTLAVIISLILPLNYNTLKLVNGEIKLDSPIVMYDKTNSKDPFLTDSKNTILKPKVDVSIEGTPNDDQVKGGGGDDKINGEDGFDTLSGEKGNDEIDGGNDNDIINGELGNDTLKGENGDDKISGGNGNELIQGGKGDDTLLGEKGDDGILGDEGSDILNGGEGADMMAGGIDNDIFICDSFDFIIDFNSQQGDKTVGQCSHLDQAENEISYADVLQGFQLASPQSPQFNHKNIPVEEHPPGPQSPIPPSQSPQFNHKNIPVEEHPPGPQSPTPFTHDKISPENFGSLPAYSAPPSNEKYNSGPFFK